MAGDKHLDVQEVTSVLSERMGGQLFGRSRTGSGKVQAAGNDVLLNLSRSLRTFSFAAYIAGCITGFNMTTAIPLYNTDD